MRFKVILALSALFIIACTKNDILSSKPELVWVVIEPIQCLGNPWERDWLESHNGDRASYPKDPTMPGIEPEEFAIIQEYYGRNGVTVYTAKTAQKYNTVCTSCSCPEGHTLYLLVEAEDVQKMIDFGYRAESPK